MMLSTDEEDVGSIAPLGNDNINQTNGIFNSIWKFLRCNNVQSIRYFQNDNSNEVAFNSIQNATVSQDAIECNTNASMSRCSNQMTVYQKMLLAFQKILKLFLKIVFKTLRLVRYAIVVIYFLIILVANMPFAILRNTIIFLKCYTNSPCVHYIPFKLIPAIIKHLWAFIQNSFFCRTKQRVTKCQSQCFNTSNSSNININHNAAVLTQENESPITTKSILIITLGILLIIIILYITSDVSKASKIQVIIIHLKTSLGSHLHGVYMFPGEKCMRAGRCCKGYMEGLFRWMSCFITIPIRILLTLWPKKPFETTSRFEGIHGIRNYIEKITEQLNEIKEEISYQGEILLDIQSNFINLAQKVQEKANSINILKPKVQKSKMVIEQMKRDMDAAILLLNEIITIRNDVDRLQDLVKIEADDSASFTLGAMNRLHTSIESEQHRLFAQIENLELLMKGDQVKSEDKNHRVLQRIIAELQTIKDSQDDMKRRMQPLIQLPLKYKEMSDILQKDITNKLNEEMVHHEQMSKRTEKVCIVGVEKLQNALSKSKADLHCFVNRTVQAEGLVLLGRLRNDVSNALHDRTVEMAITITEQVLSKQPKSFNRLKKKVKKCSLMTYVFNVQTPNPQCFVENSTIVAVPNACILTDTNRKMTPDIRKKHSVDGIIDETLRLLSTDDILMADYALESAGGSVVADRSSATYSERAAFLSLFGFTFGKIVKSIRKIIQVGALPGECWAFEQDKGHVVIRLAKSIFISHITIDHVSRLLTPNGEIKSAPKKFNVYSLNGYEDYSGVKIGEFQYSQHGDAIQTFYINESSLSTQYIQVNFLSNHGNSEYTCIYRIRVHGDISKQI